ncbi:ANL_collapsed_G0029360.mRNA.1.CDS.1 [Saccharomyces cerevisiae]|nr:ANL_collapsed_G0029360.mRNA.1.CDS.1 [Saccharomyces cerevisiae]
MSSESGKPIAKPIRKPGYTNPALKALGIPALRLPSRNWMIFWSVLTVSIGGIAYDKYKQRQILSHATDLVKPLAEESMEVDKVPRKITVFIAPPPNDYLESSLKVWRRYVKPVLYYAGLDYELVQEDRQGIIRTNVANRIRELRKEILASTDGQPVKEPNQKVAKPSGSSTSKISSLLPFNKIIQDPAEEDDSFDPEIGKKFKENFDWRNVIGIFYTMPKPKHIISEDALTKDPILSGGVICLGRGAYKELAWTHREDRKTGSTEPKMTGVVEANQIESKVSESGATELVDAEKETALEEVKVQDDLKVDEENSSEDSQKFLKSFFSSDQYPDLQIASELQTPNGEFIRNPNTNIPLLINQPLLVIPIPNLIGFTTIPRRIHRFYQKRFYVEDVCSSVVNCVRQTRIRPFDIAKDIDLAKDEEKDWPQNWVKQVCDPRITKHMFVYEKPPKEEPESDI